MNDSTLPRRISHKGHNHPDNSYQRMRCRGVIESTGKPLDVSKPPARKKRAPKEDREPLVEFLDRTTVEPEPAPKKEKVKAQRRRMSLSEIRGLGEGLDYVAEALGEYAAVESVDVTLRMEDHKVLASYDGHDWHFEAL